MKPLFVQVFGTNQILMGIVVTIVTGLATGAGHSGAFHHQRLRVFLDALLGFPAV